MKHTKASFSLICHLKVAKCLSFVKFTILNIIVQINFSNIQQNLDSCKNSGLNISAPIEIRTIIKATNKKSYLHTVSSLLVLCLTSYVILGLLPTICFCFERRQMEDTVLVARWPFLPLVDTIQRAEVPCNYGACIYRGPGVIVPRVPLIRHCP